MTTPWERDALAMPAHLPGLLRRGSAIVIADRDDASIPQHLRGRRGTVHAVAPPNLGVPLASLALDGVEYVIAAVPDVLLLDLTDATGRAHLAWWLTGHVGASFHRSCDGHRRWEAHGGERPGESASHAWEGIGDAARRLRGDPPMYGWDADDVPSLDLLDLRDSRTLPDGSRLVDALALGLVGRHEARLPLPDGVGRLENP